MAGIDGKNFELKIYSGTDRIYTTKNCAKAVKPVVKVLAPEQAVAWAMKWDGKRSKSGCGQRPEAPRPGTYFATAQLTDAKPVQLRIVIQA